MPTVITGTHCYSVSCLVALTINVGNSDIIKISKTTVL